jgi:hypothetical protein
MAHLFRGWTDPDDGTVECRICGRKEGESNPDCRKEIPTARPGQATSRPRRPQPAVHIAADAAPTSIEAAEAALPASVTRQTRVLAVIVDRGAVGATDDEIEALTGWSHQTVSARRRDLAIGGLVEEAYRGGGPLRRLTRQDRAAQVWVATDGGRQALTAEVRAGAA